MWQSPGLLTPKPSKKNLMSSTSKALYIDKRLPTSNAFLSLKTATATQVLMIFYLRRRVVKVRGKKGRMGFEVINKDKLTFTYSEASRKYGITAPRFARAIDELVQKGFLDIARTGMGLHKLTTFYSLSDRWLDYGTERFCPAQRHKSRQFNMGFKRGNQLAKSAREEKTTNANVHGTMNADVHGGLIAMYTNVHGQVIKTVYKPCNSGWLATEIA